MNRVLVYKDKSIRCLAGSPTVGKTTLCYQLIKDGYSIIESDVIIWDLFMRHGDNDFIKKNSKDQVPPWHEKNDSASKRVWAVLMHSTQYFSAALLTLDPHLILVTNLWPKEHLNNSLFVGRTPKRMAELMIERQTKRLSRELTPKEIRMYERLGEHWAHYDLKHLSKLFDEFVVLNDDEYISDLFNLDVPQDDRKLMDSVIYDHVKGNVDRLIHHKGIYS